MNFDRYNQTSINVQSFSTGAINDLIKKIHCKKTKVDHHIISGSYNTILHPSSSSSEPVEDHFCIVQTEFLNQARVIRPKALHESNMAAMFGQHYGHIFALLHII